MEKKLDLSSFGIKPEELTREIESGASIKLKKLEVILGGESLV